jgi:hypothetical protein
VNRAKLASARERVAISNWPLGKVRQVPVEWLRPTQMAVGMRAVKFKRRKIEQRGGKRIEKVLSGKPIPTVRGPNNELFIIDHHHFGLALWQSGVESAYVRVIDDISALSASQFWRRMEANGRVYLYDEEGRRISPDRLPTWLHGLRHDPFRDIAWAVREAGGFSKSPEPFAEFQWANYFRDHIPIRTVRRNYEGAIAKAMALTRSRDARALPGYLMS